MFIPWLDASSGKAEPQRPHRHDYVLLPVCFILLPLALLLVAGAVLGEPVRKPASSACLFEGSEGRSHCFTIADQPPRPTGKTPAAGARTTSYQTVASGAPTRQIVMGCEQPVRFPSAAGLAWVPTHPDGSAGALPTAHAAEEAAQELVEAEVVRGNEPAEAAHGPAPVPPAFPAPQTDSSNYVVFTLSDKPLRVSYRLLAERLLQQVMDAALPVLNPCASPVPEAMAAERQAG